MLRTSIALGGIDEVIYLTPSVTCINRDSAYVDVVRDIHMIICLFDDMI